MSLSQYRIVAIVPCHNEEAAIGKVVSDLRTSVPHMTVVVFDNCSTDDTARLAADAGALVCQEPRKGKGNVVRRAFADLDADIYLLIDGDDTYDAAAAPRLIQKLVNENLDHVVGVRRESAESSGQAYRRNHRWGNAALNRLVQVLFGDSMDDMLSGYRVFSRRFVKSFPATSREFEIETELTLHSLALRVPCATVPVGFKDRPEGSASKLRTYRDGTHIAAAILRLTLLERPLLLMTFLAALAGVAAVLEPVSLAGGLLFLLLGLILDTARRSRQQTNRFAYMRFPAVRTPYVSDPAPGVTVAVELPSAAVAV